MNPQATRDPDAGAAKALLLLLSVTAGTADIIGYLGMNGLFTAQITGNLAIIAAQFVQRGSVHLTQLLSVPVFVAAVVLATLYAGLRARVGRDPLRTLLSLQLLLLVGFLVAGVSAPDPDSGTALAAGMLGVSAMAVQNALVQHAFKGAPSTTVMTSNTARLGLALGTWVLSRDATATDRARGDVVRTGIAILGFIAGCVLGTVCETAFGLRALVLPVVLAAIAVGIESRIVRDRRTADPST